MYKEFFDYDLNLQKGQSMLTQDNHNRIPYILKDDEGKYRVIESIPITGFKSHLRGDAVA